MPTLLSGSAEPRERDQDSRKLTDVASVVDAAWGCWVGWMRDVGLSGQADGCLNDAASSPPPGLVLTVRA